MNKAQGRPFIHLTRIHGSGKYFRFKRYRKIAKTEKATALKEISFYSGETDKVKSYTISGDDIC